jgi:hypothetical protein
MAKMVEVIKEIKPNIIIGLINILKHKITTIKTSK